MALFKNETKRKSLREEYEKVNSSPVLKYAIQFFVTVIDIAVLLVLVWNMYHFCIPSGSWTNIVSGDSMSPTLHSGQITYTELNGDFKRGDIVTLTTPAHSSIDKNQIGKIFIKRIVAIPGDTLSIRNDGIYINNSLVYESYLSEEAKAATYQEDQYNNVVLGDDTYFVMGDNRGNSLDSRAFGPVSRDNLLYKQSDTPTTNFYLKLALSVMVIALNIFVYLLLEFIITECVYAILLKFNKNKFN